MCVTAYIIEENINKIKRFLEYQVIFEVGYIYMFQDIRIINQLISSLKNIHDTYQKLSLIKIKSLIQLKNARINGKHPHFSHSSLYVSVHYAQAK